MALPSAQASPGNQICISIVSHQHGAMVADLIRQLSQLSEVGQIVVTLNIPEALALPQHPSLQIIRNVHPKGFAANHNAAFLACSQAFFCPLNPDVSFQESPFGTLLSFIQQQTKPTIAAPLVLSPQGAIENSARRFPQIRTLLRKAVGTGNDALIAQDDQAFPSPWVAGMCMLFRSRDFSTLGGFDESYFLYYEDADICTRAWRAGMQVAVCQTARITHAAQRDSHRKLRYLRWHISSMLRYFWRYWGRYPTENYSKTIKSFPNSPLR